jgi:Ca2+-binding RTX toxin-like protein
MATITIGATSGNYDFDASDLSLSQLLNTHASAEMHIKTGKNGVANGTIDVDADKGGQSLEVSGGFYLNKMGKSAHVASFVHNIDSATFLHGKTTLVSMTDLGLTGSDLKSDSTFADYLDSQSYTINGNNSNNVITGAGAADKLFGNGGNDTLDGGAGKDTMTGGSGNDTYHYTVGDKIVETKGLAGGFDTIVTSTSIDLNKFDSVEAVTLQGKANVNAIGNDSANTLIGNDGANVLDGGKGADKLIGGNGDDTYVVDSAKDVVIETGKKDHDTIDATVSIDLSKLKTVEDVFLLGKGDLDATGNDSANTLVGNSGDNTLAGGKGNDTLTGGAGSDTFVFHKGDKFDTITDFDAAGKDHDILDLSGFGKIKFANLDISKAGHGDYEVDFGHGDVLHIHLDHSSIKDVDASDFQF